MEHRVYTLCLVIPSFQDLPVVPEKCLYNKKAGKNKRSSPHFLYMIVRLFCVESNDSLVQFLLA